MSPIDMETLVIGGALLVSLVAALAIQKAALKLLLRILGGGAGAQLFPRRNRRQNIKI